ncbi:MAG: aminotransferase class III-fold pyridoxal phosphate-dependent enzyme [Lentisphaeria bacterium]|jgi:adenosylmethionine-8-amino-7-oxononanoate aminotransferase|nr:aminotransferase class III-fold pyridoxal phosphate-dependent enzyme [Lentisphaeria bacterium]MDP7739972.1 aminotransferase class III-fold pyridoxal phosphate-dependent enzyme [Lentisphaeria bacterium]
MMTSRQEALLKNTFIDLTQTLEFLEQPLVFSRAEGLYVYDQEDKCYFDAIGGIFVASLGHRHPRILEAMRQQMERITFAPPLHGISDITLEFIEKLGSVTPDDLNFVKAFSGGSESIEAALKFVRQYHKQTGRPGKFKFIGRYLGYHGSTFGAMSASGTGRRKTMFEPLPAGFLHVFPPTHYRDRFDSWEACNRFAAESFEEVIVHEDPDTVAGIIVEPISNTGGIITPTPEYYRIIRDICDRHNVLLIFDEIITGFAKTGAMFAAQAYGVTPDIICSGKGLGGGHMPMGAMIAREGMGQAFLGPAKDAVEFAHGNTFAGNPLACAAGIAMIDEIVEQDLCAKAGELGDYLADRLNDLKKYGVVREVRGMGILRGVELVADTTTMAPFPALGAALKKTAVANGLIMRVDPHWFAVAPPLIAGQSDIDEMCGLIDKSLREALEATGR